MSKFDHWMRFNVGDYLSDTMHLSTFQHGIYFLLIMHYFKRGELPLEESGLARIAKIPMFQWRQQSPPVMGLFKVVDGLLRHPRIDAERDRSRAVSEAKRDAAMVGVQQRQKPAGNGHSEPAYADEEPANAGVPRPGARATPELNLNPTSQEAPPTPPVNGGERRERRVNGGRKESKAPHYKNGWDEEGNALIAAEEADDRPRSISTSRH